jgi:seryl-tRNA synthetase
MLDRKFITENAGTVQQNCIHRGVQVDVDHLVQIEVERRAQQNEVQELNTQANANNKRIKQAADSEQREAIIEEGRRLRERKDLAQAACDALDAEAYGIQRLIPNLSHPDAPIGKDDKANLEISKGQHAPCQFGFKPLDHVELGQRLDLFDFESAAKITGHGFYFLKNDAVLLDLSLQRYALDLLIAEGFTPTITPDLARNEILEGVGFIPRGPETQIYSVENSDLSLIATAEITLGGLLSGQTLDAEDLPLRFVGISHCYRTEAGAHGRATRGLFRVHQFTKVEMFTFTLPDQSDAMLGRLRDLECRLFDGLEIPYRVVDTATGDLGGPAYRKFDLEAWMPGRGDGGEYAEVTSTSNCTDYQSRRLGVRYKTKGEKGTNFVHTLNGTAVAISRAIIAVLENHQQEDGSVLLPEALRPYMGKDRIVAKS